MGYAGVLRRLAGMAGLLAILLVLALSWPGQRLKPSPLPQVPQSPPELENWLARREASVPGLRPDNQARIVWADPRHRARTACSIVYLHGFTASQGEGAPLHRQLARAFGCNLYLPRLPGHGLSDDNALRGVQAQQFLDAAAEAVAVGQVLGERTILIGTSMGGALATQMAAQHGDRVAATVLWSPLVQAYQRRMQQLLWRPWGVTLLKYWKNGGRDIVVGARTDSVYWARAAHLDGYAAAAALSHGMNAETFARVRMPVFVGYYFRGALHQDQTVSVAALQRMPTQLGTPPALRWRRNFPDAGDHVIASPLRSRASGEVYVSTCRFLREAAGLVPVVANACVPVPQAPDVPLSVSR